MSFFRRAGASILKVIQSAAAPSAVAQQVILYAKAVGGVAQLFALTSNGNEYQLTPSGVIMINYVATGAEGTDFNVAIGQTLPNDTYGVAWAPAGVSNVPVLDLPNLLAGDRTTTQFRVLLAAPFTAGDRITFFVFPN